MRGAGPSVHAVPLLATSAATDVVCVRSAHPLDDPHRPCPVCLREGWHVNGTVVHDLSAVDREAPLASLLAGALLPVALPSEAPSPVRLLHRDVSGPRVRLKDERFGPTWSYKDRLARVAAADAAGRNAEVVVVASSGNHGAAVAAACAAQGLSSVVLCTPTIAPPMRALVLGVGGHLVPVPTVEDRWQVMDDAVRELGWYPAGNFHVPPIGSPPHAVEGYKMIAYELAAQGPLPDWIVVPVGYGDGLTGVAKGLLELAALGIVERPPRVLAAVTASSLPDALEGDTPPVTTPVVAPEALSIACPQGTVQAEVAIRETSGAAVVVDNAAAHDARDELSRQGIFVELSTAAGLAAVDVAAADGIMQEDEEVVLVLTSTGLKDQLFERDQDALDPVESSLDGLLAGAAALTVR